MNIEQMKEIVDNAPDGATHCTDETPSMNLYAKVEHLGGFYVSLSNRWEPYPIYAGIHLLSDFTTIIAQHEEIERLRSIASGLAKYPDGTVRGNDARDSWRYYERRLKGE